MPGIRDNFKSWWNKQKEEFNLQRALASRDSAAKKHNALYKAELDKAQRQAKAKGECDPYDLLMERYNQRLNIRDNPEKFRTLDKLNAQAGKQHGNATGCSMALDGLYGEGNMNNINKDNMKGRGWGAWLGRLVTGRRDSGVRATGVAAFNTHLKETGFNSGEMQEVWKLQQCEAEIRSGALTAEEVLARGLDDFEKKYDPDQTVAKLKSQNMEGRKQTAGPESTDTIEQFRVLAQDKAAELDRKLLDHDADFFPDLYEKGVLDAQKTNKIMHPDKTNRSQTLDRINSRMTLARAYMYAQGDTMDQIYGDSKESKDLRARRGRELMGKLTGSVEETGKMYAQIAKKIIDFPTPDMSSDAMLYNNMREINFIKDASINMTQIINLRREDREDVRPRHALENAFHDNLSKLENEKFNNMTQNGQALNFNGIEARIKFLASGDYSLTPVIHEGKKIKRSANEQIMTVFNPERQDFIKENYVPGKKIGDIKINLKETAIVSGKKQTECLSGYNSDVMEKNITKTITNGQVREIQKQVFNPKPKVKVNEQAKQDFSKELLGEKRKSIATVSNHDRKGFSPPSPKKRETTI
ncbi:MAG: hypothetical protein FWE90_13710 [Defluviitaleaceae bacterium]|nr:hypothetical protein [Defluviitaleaceae bacterium]